MITLRHLQDIGGKKLKFFSTGEVAKKLGISIRTLRYYDQIGLMVPSIKEEHGRRAYSEEDLYVLEKITLLKMLNLSLKDIGKILSKVTIEQLLYAHKKALLKKVEELDDSIKHTNTLLNIVQLEGDLKWEQIIPLVKNAQKREQKNKTWYEFITEEGQIKLQTILPKMEHDNSQIKKWMNIFRRIENCLERGQTPDSTEGQIIAEDILIISNELFAGNEELAQKFFEIRKSPDKSREMNLYPVSKEVVDFIEQAIEIFEKNLVKENAMEVE